MDSEELWIGDKSYLKAVFLCTQTWYDDKNKSMTIDM